MRKKLRYAASAADIIMGGKLDGSEDDPFHPDFIPIEVRSEADKARWWADQWDKQERLKQPHKTQYDMPVKAGY